MIGAAALEVKEGNHVSNWMIGAAALEVKEGNHVSNWMIGAAALEVKEGNHVSNWMIGAAALDVTGKGKRARGATPSSYPYLSITLCGIPSGV
jgi:acyl CoA:acetate/3-ketoacid CoA transferase beta subunit